MHARRTRIASFLSIASVLFGADASGSQNPIQTLTANSPQKWDHFGQSVAVDGDWLVVGARWRQGNGTAVFFQRNPATGAWQFFQEVAPSAATFEFGNSVALKGRLAVIGSHHGTRGVVLPSAYVFRFDGTQWAEMQRLDASNGGHDDLFGDDVSVDGDEIAVGAPSQLSNGRAYVFRWNGTSWVETQWLHCNAYATYERFGTSIALLDGVLLVGAPRGTVGHAYVLLRDPATGLYDFVQQLEASDPVTNGRFGNSVALSRDFAIVGSHFHDTTYVFERHGGNVWSQTQRLTPIEPGWFGNSVRTDGESLVISGPYQEDYGAISLYRLQGRRWVQTRYFTTHARSFLGACAVSGSTIVGGDQDATNSGWTWAGEAYVFALDAFALGTANSNLAAGQTLDLMTSGGQSGTTALLALVAVNGTPMFSTIAVGELDTGLGDGDGSTRLGGEWTVSFTIPPGLSGQTATLQSFGISDRGVFEATNALPLTFP